MKQTQQRWWWNSYFPDEFLINEIIAPLTFAIRSSFKIGIFPQRLKLATIRPLHTKGSVTECWNYRPISLLSSFSRMYSRCICDRLLEYFLQNSLFYEGQHVYLKHKRELIERSCIGLFLDLSKAYDCFSNFNLFNKLKLNVVTGLAYNWMLYLLSGRKQ